MLEADLDLLNYLKDVLSKSETDPLVSCPSALDSLLNGDFKVCEELHPTPCGCRDIHANHEHPPIKNQDRNYFSRKRRLMMRSLRSSSGPEAILIMPASYQAVSQIRTSLITSRRSTRFTICFATETKDDLPYKSCRRISTLRITISEPLASKVNPLMQRITLPLWTLHSTGSRWPELPASGDSRRFGDATGSQHSPPHLRRLDNVLTTTSIFLHVNHDTLANSQNLYDNSGHSITK